MKVNRNPTTDQAVDISVIILNWNTRELLKDCLETLIVPLPGINVQVIVADNASEDGSREMVRALFPQVELHVNSRNIGFGAGNNAAVPRATGRYVMFLNSDTKVVGDALKTIVAYGDAHPDIGILGPKLLNGDGSLQYSCRRYPNIATGFFRNTILGRLFPQNKFTTDYLMQDWDHATPRDVDWVSGAALVMRRALLDQIGAFDEDYYMYCEDVDLCWRANHAPRPTANRETSTIAPSAELAALRVDAPNPESSHWRVVYCPDAVIYHYIGKSSDQVPARMTYEFHRSQYLFYRKHYRRSTPLLLRPIILPGIVARAMGHILRYRYRYYRNLFYKWRNRRTASKAAANQVNQPASQTGGNGSGESS